MTTSLAARYLSVDEHTLQLLGRAEGIGPVAMPLELERWRRSDLDRLVRGLPMQPAHPQPVARVEAKLSDADLDRIAARLRQPAQATERRAYSIKDAAVACGLGRSTLYSLIKQARLKPVRVGGRTLLPADQVDDLVRGNL